MPASKHLLLVMSLAGLLCTGVQCPPSPTEPNDDQNPQPDPWLEIAATPETELNGNEATATPVAFDAAGKARLTGTIPTIREGPGVDYWNLGPMTAGDRLTLEVVTPGTDLKTIAAVFDADGRLFELQSWRESDQGVVDPAIDDVIRHSSTAYYLVVCRAPRAGLVGGLYEVRISVERGGPVPPTRPQTVWLNFEGGTVTLPDEGPLAFGRFDPQDIDPAYAGQNATVRHWIVETVKQNYARYNVTVLNSDDGPAPADGPFSTVYFGGYAPRSLGEAVTGTDPYNANPDDDVVVFPQRFTEDLFTVRPDARGLGTAIGNVAAHEIGHLLGLNHVHQAYDLMNGYDAPDNLLGDQRFKNSLLNLTIFPVNDILLGQDGHLLLAETVGLVPPASDADLTVCAEPAALAVGDLDENGAVDIVAACPTSLEVWVLWNDGAGAFPTHGMASGFGASSVGVADLNGDGHPDLFGTDVGSGGVFVYMNQGGGNFGTAAMYPTGDGPWSLTAADLTGDGRPDLVVVNSFDDNVTMLPNRGDGTFAASEVISAAAFPLSVTAADFNGDQWVDLAFGNSGTQTLPGGVWVLLNDGAGGFLPPTAYVEAALASGVATGDVNGDGLPDLIVADTFASRLSSGTADVLLNDGNGGFGSPAYYMAGDQSSAVAVGDLNGDGWPDLVLANRGTGDVSVLLNRGDGAFEPEWPYRVGGTPAAVAIADLNGDGRPDIVVAGEDTGTVSILLNKGNGRFGK